MVQQETTENHLVTTSSELSSSDLQILISDEKNLVVVKSNFSVAIYCSKTTRIVAKLFNGDKILCIWLKNDQNFEEVVCAMSASGFIYETSLSSAKFDEKIKKTEIPNFAKIPDNTCFSRPQVDADGSLDTVYFVTSKDDKRTFELASKSFKLKRSLKFGNVTRHDDNFLFAFNRSLSLKCGVAVSGKKGQKLTFSCAAGVHRPWYFDISQRRTVTAVACHPSGEKIALTGDSNGRIQIWRQKGNFEFFSAEVHWHSLPVRSLSFSPEGVHFMSGGGEGAILKWDLASGRRVAIVPRLGSTVTSIAASHSTIVATISTNAMKIFTANLEDLEMITGMSTETQESGIFWHPQTRSVVLKGSRRRIQFFDPIQTQQKLSLEASSQSDVLGDRTFDSKSLSALSLLSLSPCGNWLATVEANWDTLGGNCLKIWNFSSLNGQATFELNTRINGAHDAKICHVTFVGLKTTVGIVTCGREGKAKLWSLGEGMADNKQVKRWDPVRTFSHIGRTPRCSDSSRDCSILAIAFDAQVTLWSTETLALISTLSTAANSAEFYTCLAFGPGHNLLATNSGSVHVWNLLTNQLTHRMALEVPKLIKSPKTIQIASKAGIFVVDQGMKLKCLTKNVGCHVGLTCSDSRCFVVERTSSENRLYSFSLDGNNQNEESTSSPSLPDEQHLSLMTSSMASVKLSAKENLHAPKQGPSLTATMIGNPVSKSSLFILKQSLPA